MQTIINKSQEIKLNFSFLNKINPKFYFILRKKNQKKIFNVQNS